VKALSHMANNLELSMLREPPEAREL